MHTLRVGSEHQTSFSVESSQTISFEGLPPVLATPWLIWQVEHAAFELLVPYLEEGEQSVGTHVDLQHLAPALTGAVVSCSARVVNVDGPRVTFSVEASDETETLARGLHRRHVVQTSRLARRLERKSRP